MNAQAKADTRCTYCHKRIHRQRNGAWYHDHNGSTSCGLGSGGTKAFPKPSTDQPGADQPRSLGGVLPITRRCWRGQHGDCLGSWTAYPDQSGRCECSCHGDGR